MQNSSMLIFMKNCIIYGIYSSFSSIASKFLFTSNISEILEINKNLLAIDEKELYIPFGYSHS